MARKKRSYTTEFKRNLVLEFLSGETTAGALCRRYELSATCLERWTQAYQEGRLDDSQGDEREGLKARVRELERLVGFRYRSSWRYGLSYSSSCI